MSIDEKPRWGAAAPGPVNPGQMASGSVINGIYRLVRRLGAGGMGEVWEARHERTRGRVAVKVLLPDMGRDEDVLRRFQREVEITSALNHPNIVRVSDADKLPDGRPFLVMEFLEGSDLASATAGGPPPLPQVLDIIEQIAMGLQAAHGQAVVHRDLKPANIFLVPLPGTARVVVKILDFGISKALDGLSKLTHTRSVVGTPYYMAPEQARAGSSSLDARADQFSLAAIAYELVAGRMAFDGDGVVNVLYKVVQEPPPSFASLGVEAPAGVEAVILRGLSKQADDRYATVLEFSEALKVAAGGGVIERRPTLRMEKPMIGQTIPLPTPRATTLSASTGEIAAPRRISPRSSPFPADPRDAAVTLKPSRKPAALLVGGAAVVALAIVAVAILRRPLPALTPVAPEPAPVEVRPLAPPPARVPAEEAPRPPPAVGADDEPGRVDSPDDDSKPKVPAPAPDHRRKSAKPRHRAAESEGDGTAIEDGDTKPTRAKPRSKPPAVLGPTNSTL